MALKPEKPLKVFHMYGWGDGVSIAVWRNQQDAGYNFKITRKYALQKLKPSDPTEWKELTFLSEEGAAAAIICLQQALAWISQQEAYRKLPHTYYGGQPRAEMERAEVPPVLSEHIKFDRKEPF